jgi:hypothetical protein
MNKILKFIQQLFTDSSRTNKQLPQYDKRQSPGQKTVIRNRTNQNINKLELNQWGYGWPYILSIGGVPVAKGRSTIFDESKIPPPFASGGIVPKDKIKQSPYVEHEMIVHPHHLDVMDKSFNHCFGPRLCIHEMIDVTSTQDQYKKYICVKCGLELDKDSNISERKDTFNFWKHKGRPF